MSSAHLAGLAAVAKWSYLFIKAHLMNISQRSGQRVQEEPMSELTLTSLVSLPTQGGIFPLLPEATAADPYGTF